MRVQKSRTAVQWGNSGEASGRGFLHGILVIVLLGIGAGRPVVDFALAQDEVKNFRKPILMVETGGHHARVRSLVWQDGSTLLSGGEDKVVRVWDLHQGQRLARSLRPPIWRGPAGTIYAMALTRPDANGQSFLAVGGYGVENRRGDLTIFRARAIALAHDPSTPMRLQTLREQMRERLRRSPACDMAAFARRMESLLFALHAARSGNRPRVS